MNDPVRQLYSEKRYPALSHPVTDISRLAVSARFAGLQRLPLPERSSVLEFGCASGQNLLPLAARYPKSQFTGLDYSDSAIRSAREAAREAGLDNILFEVADLEHWRPTHPCDYLIVHGVFSWVPDAVKTRVMELCGQVLSENGVACVSYNTLPGWALKNAVTPLIRALVNCSAAKGLGETPEAIAASIREMAGGAGTAHAVNLKSVCDGIVKKGSEILPFDEFSPVCDAVYFGQFAHWASQQNLRYLGEAALEQGLPDGLDPAALEKLAPLAADPLMFHQTLDLLSGRTHRVSLLSRKEAAVEEATTSAAVMHFALGRGEFDLPEAGDQSGLIRLFREVLAEAGEDCVPVRDLMEKTAARLDGGWEPTRHSGEISMWISQMARLGCLELRAEGVEIARSTLEKPRISPLNRWFAANGRPVVDARHASCHFPEGHEKLLAVMDGTKTTDELIARSHEEFPELNFMRWLDHLAARGIVE